MTHADSRLTERLGFERDLLMQLSPVDRRALRAMSGGWMTSALLLGVPVAYAAWLIEKNAILSLVLFSFTAILVINLLRLITAGGGAAPFVRLPARYRPSLAPGVMIFGLALMLAQPAQLMVAPQVFEETVDAHRTELMAIHQASQAALGTPTDDGYEGELLRCEFILLRLRLLWTQPVRAVFLSALFCGLVLTPFLLSHTIWLTALRSHERLRYARSRREIRERTQRASTEAQLALARFASYRAPKATDAFLSARLVRDEGPLG